MKYFVFLLCLTATAAPKIHDIKDILETYPAEWLKNPPAKSDFEKWARKHRYFKVKCSVKRSGSTEFATSVKIGGKKFSVMIRSNHSDLLNKKYRGGAIKIIKCRKSSADHYDYRPKGTHMTFKATLQVIEPITICPACGKPQVIRVQVGAPEK